ncbi:MAG TPA: PEP/pyruvate-binding domain-containing protein [Anaerolineae bacterium]|nr:PEP/pyruvate-binding domain-containing protein [Anaerolineae bacterium]
MSELIRPLSDITAADTPTVGTKAAALAELRRAGYFVPNGFVLTTPAYAEFINPLREKIRACLTDDVIMDPSEIERAATEIRGWLQDQSFSSRLLDELKTALASLDGSPNHSFAARSSTPSDDLATAFGSGVARAYLGLVGADEIAQAAARGWAALWNSRSMYYRHRKKIPQTDVAFAILVQPMIYASAAGVMFTQNPMNGANDEIQISSIWGLGAPLTSARSRPTQFILDKTSGEILDRTLTEQVVQLVVGATGHTEERGVAPEQINTPSLTDAKVKQLAELGKRIESYFHSPQDIEWAIADNEIYILQARPISVRNA